MLLAFFSGVNVRDIYRLIINALVHLIRYQSFTITKNEIKKIKYLSHMLCRIYADLTWIGHRVTTSVVKYRIARTLIFLKGTTATSYHLGSLFPSLFLPPLPLFPPGNYRSSPPPFPARCFILL